MQKLLFLLISIFLINQANSQSRLKGVVLYQNSGGKPAENLKILASDTYSAFTDSNGLFEMVLDTNSPGEYIKIEVDSTAGIGKDLQVVNNWRLKWRQIPSDPDEELIKIIVCPKTEFNSEIVHYKNILEKATHKEFEKKQKELKKQIESKQKSSEEVRLFRVQLISLKKENKAALRRYDEVAKFMASIDKDRASETVKKALQEINRGNIGAAFVCLSDTNTDVNPNTAQEVERYELSYRLLYPLLRKSEFLGFFEAIIELESRTNYYDKDLSGYYVNAAWEQCQNKNYSKAVDYLEKAISVRNKIQLPKDNGLAAIYSIYGYIY